MIAIKVELWPYGDQKKAKVLGLAMIANDGTGTPTIGNYDAVISDHKGARNYPARVEGFQRQKESAWELLRRALNEALS